MSPVSCATMRLLLCRLATPEKGDGLGPLDPKEMDRIRMQGSSSVMESGALDQNLATLIKFGIPLRGV